MKNKYSAPTIESEKSFTATALSCGRGLGGQVGSHHMTSAYDTFTGHFGPGFGVSSSVSPGQAGVGFGPGGTSQSYALSGLCHNWVAYSST